MRRVQPRARRGARLPRAGAARAACPELPGFPRRKCYTSSRLTERLVQTAMDRYVVLEYLAEGGMGAIYLGKKLGAGGFEKEVVLKQLLPEFTQQPEFIDLFLREARLSATLDHANIVHTIDLVNAGDQYFIVMEHVDG